MRQCKMLRVSVGYSIGRFCCSHLGVAWLELDGILCTPQIEDTPVESGPKSPSERHMNDSGCSDLCSIQPAPSPAPHSRSRRIDTTNFQIPSLTSMQSFSLTVFPTHINLLSLMLLYYSLALENNKCYAYPLRSHESTTTLKLAPSGNLSDVNFCLLMYYLPQ